MLIKSDQPTKSEVEVKQHDNKAQTQLIVFPSKFIDPISTYRLHGDFHLYSDAKKILRSNNTGLSLSCQNPYKRVQKIKVDELNQLVVVDFTQMDFTITPWEFVVKRMQSLGDKDVMLLSRYIEQFNQQLNSGITNQTPYDINITKYRGFIQYQYKYLKDLKQMIISRQSFNFKIIEELGYEIQQFVYFCLKNGIPELSLQSGCSTSDYCRNIMELIKPMIDQNSKQEFYLYSPSYPNGLRTFIQFQYEQVENSDPSFDIINLNYYLDYEPINYKPSLSYKHTIHTNNCISKYYLTNESSFSRCGISCIDPQVKKVKI